MSHTVIGSTEMLDHAPFYRIRTSSTIKIRTINSIASPYMTLSYPEISNVCNT